MSNLRLTDRVSTRARNESTWRSSSVALYAGDLAGFLDHWVEVPRYAVAYPIDGVPQRVEGREAFLDLFGGFAALAESIGVHDVRFHQTDNPEVAFVEERMVAELHDGSRYENLIVMRDVRGRPDPRHLRVLRRGRPPRPDRPTLRQAPMSARLGTGRLHGPGLTDVRMMTVAHTSFRRELKLGVPAVRDTQDGDLQRAAEVADHIEMWLGFVHHHHAIEDELLWDRLLTRLPTDKGQLIHLMEQQHATIARLLDGAPALLAGWRATGTPTDGTALADHLAELVERLCEHLDTEEAEVLPLMARHISAAEWEEFTVRGMESIPKALILTGFGMMLYEGDPEAIALEIAKLPAPLRPILPPLGRWAFRRYARRVHGTPSPAPGRS